MLRQGLTRFSPYLFILLLYGWIVLHNRLLFQKLYLQQKKRAYFWWTLGIMTFSTCNMYYILHYAFHVGNIWPQVVSFWVYTLTGLGVYVLFRYFHVLQQPVIRVPVNRIPHEFGATFDCLADGVKKSIPYIDIWYIESLENYIKVITISTQHIVRLTLKEAEERLPPSQFLRVNRSQIINLSHLQSITTDTITVRDKVFKIGKVYKRYVEKELSGTRAGYTV